MDSSLLFGGPGQEEGKNPKRRKIEIPTTSVSSSSVSVASIWDTVTQVYNEVGTGYDGECYVSMLLDRMSANLPPFVVMRDARLCTRFGTRFHGDIKVPLIVVTANRWILVSLVCKKSASNIRLTDAASVGRALDQLRKQYAPIARDTQFDGVAIVISSDSLSGVSVSASGEFDIISP
jgi:hypothetical protein